MDTTTGRVEHEWDHVLTGVLEGRTPVPDPNEVADYTWQDPDVLRQRMTAGPHEFTPWLADVLRLATHHR
ncbi:hypothetical protein EV193_102400 [Herbihabitans rhizosphaerae]|uniref:Uncharacterized protein n=1 Tax=Herbihabitans rhizosphaerae TaxID=1872711 RepID=A0A4Q7L4J3_9PSEU|nr:hypothetical protein EV193_102400 [Herbihabitans rhizosphaerae]